MKSIEYIDRKTGKLLTETVPGEQWLKWLYHNPVGKLALECIVKRKFSTDFYGKKMDKAKSKNKIPVFVKDLNIDMDEAKRPVEDFENFNDFFIRELKPNARPIDSDNKSITSPADGKILAFENIDGFDSFFVKGQKFSLEKFLDDKELSNKFKDGTLLIIRLAPVDYHRFHFPYNGKISKSKLINGDYYSVSPYAVKNKLSVYFENKREYSILSTEKAGDILLCEIGATMVGSIIQSYKENSNVKKGDEKGWFKFGGSTVIALIEKDKANIDKDIIENTKKGLETSVKMGEKIAEVL